MENFDKDFLKEQLKAVFETAKEFEEQQNEINILNSAIKPNFVNFQVTLRTNDLEISQKEIQQKLAEFLSHLCGNRDLSFSFSFTYSSEGSIL